MVDRHAASTAIDTPSVLMQTQSVLDGARQPPIRCMRTVDRYGRGQRHPSAEGALLVTPKAPRMPRPPCLIY